MLSCILGGQNDKIMSNTKGFTEQIELHELRENGKKVAKYTHHLKECKLVNGQMSMSSHERHMCTQKDCTCGLTDILRALGHEE